MKDWLPFKGKTFRFNFFLVVVFALNSGCGSDPTKIDLTENLIIAMNTVFEEPAGAAGSAEPKNLSLTLNALSITGTDGTQIDLFEDSEATTLKIVSRSQIIFEADISEYEGTTFSSIAVGFSPAGSAKSPSDEDLSFVLPESNIVHNEEWSVSVSKSYRLTLLASWKNTVTIDEDSGNESIQSPSITAQLVDE